MSGRCRNCGGTSARRRASRQPYRRQRTVFGQMGFWGWLCVVLAVVWVLSDLGVIGS
jgi:hypothetical protein